MIWVYLIAELSALACIVCSAILFYYGHSIGWLFAVLSLFHSATVKSGGKKKDEPR